MTADELVTELRIYRDAIAGLRASPGPAHTFLDDLPRPSTAPPLSHSVHYKLIDAELALATAINEITFALAPPA
jgi:hypothetical protein